jgi:hypothetical protein
MLYCNNLLGLIVVELLLNVVYASLMVSFSYF